MNGASATDPSQPTTMSVVIPAYNEEAYLARALRSVLGQTLPPSEIIVVDDGSTDGTGRVAAEFGERVRCVRQDNRGLPAARNRGIREASGEFVALLDADDEWLPHHLEQAAAVLAANPHLQWWCGAYERRAEDGTLEYQVVYSGPLENGAYARSFFEAAARSNLITSSSVVIRRQVLLDLGGFDEAIRTHGEDLDLWFRIALRYPEIGYSPTISMIYWGRAQSIMASYTKPSCERLWQLIERSDARAVECGPAAVKLSEPLTLTWIGWLVRRAIRQSRRDVLAQVRARYGRRLRFSERGMLAASRFLPCAVLAWMLAAGSWLKGFLGR
jgi:glycosyltransferase involved in cell wall biosynthesis